MTDDPFVIKLVGMVHGIPTTFDGEFLAEYDADRPGVDPNGVPMLVHVRSTPNVHEALTFDVPAAARACWMRVPKDDPVRPDGEPNRPLTAFTVEIARRSTFAAEVGA